MDGHVEHGQIEIYGAAEHNLQHIDLTIPRNKIIVFTGLSGSGKSSLAFDTIYAEGQRRYMESFSAYARQFMGHMKRPEVEKIEGLSPVISIEQKTISKNPRSTVGTITEIYDFLRLLYARVGEPYSYVTGKKMVRFTEEEILESIESKFAEKGLLILAPVVRGRKGHYRELFERYRKAGFTKMRIDGEITDLVPKQQISRYKIHDIELVVDRIKVTEKQKPRLVESIRLALKEGNGLMMVHEVESNTVSAFSRNLMCTDSGIAYDEAQPNTFSFNSPYGYCPKCKGVGHMHQFDIEAITNGGNASVKDAFIEPFKKYIDASTVAHIKAVLKRFRRTSVTKVKELPEEALEQILYGGANVDVDFSLDMGTNTSGGLLGYFQSVLSANWNREFIDILEGVSSYGPCSECEGFRLKKESLNYKLDGLHIGQTASLQLDKFHDWIHDLPHKLGETQKRIATEILKEIRERTGFLLDVGLQYLSLFRPSFSLSGGEAQRIRLATQIGTQLTNVLYILDEPSIGLHQRDNTRLIESLQNLRDVGNSVLVVEHDKDMMLAADYIVDLGPKAGINGGKIVAQGTPQDFLKQKSLTADYLADRLKIEVPKNRRAGNGKTLALKGATGHNLQNVDVEFPLGTLICVSGVSGSGKSSLINGTLYPILKRHFYRSNAQFLPYNSIEGLEHIDKVIEIDQAPIGRTPRSNPATYTGVFTDIRNLFALLPESKIRGYAPGRFSFNVKGGRCEDCSGGGMKLIEMNFLPDVYVECPTCFGMRYNRQTLEVRYKGHSISDVLEMPIENAVEFFEHLPSVKRKLQALVDVGLGYIKLGQPSTTLSGGEAQRVKLASELSKKATGSTFYIMDEPTTGLHFEDIRILLQVIETLVDKGNTVLIIEHNLDVIKTADHIIDLGPEGGDGGGKIIAEGTPEKIAESKISHTGKYLKKELS
ncbi:MAG: excinuclease ABC subunit UvrA [Bacteroidetes bacterium]|nr:excinuclease ABC subunit UvrA [Bacteroidota bacterium]